MNKLTFIFFLIISVSAVHAQQNNNSRTGSLTSGTIDSQFMQLNAMSRSQDDFKLIRRTNLEIVRKNVTDSLNHLRNQIGATAKTIKNQETEIANLADSLTQVKEQLQVSEANQTKVRLLGISMDKSVVNWLFIIILITLGSLLSFYVYRFGQSSRLTIDAKKAYDDLHEEFESHRKKALEREQKLKRQLQDELNKRTG